MRKKKIRGYYRRIYEIDSIIRNTEYVSNLFNESRELNSLASKYYKECKDNEIEYNPDIHLPDDLKSRINSLKDKFNTLRKMKPIYKRSIINDLVSGKIYISLRNGRILILDKKRNEIKYNIINNELVCIK